MLAFVSGTTGCGSCSNDATVEDDGVVTKMNERPIVLQSAAGATRLIVSSSERFAVAEFAGSWRDDFSLRRYNVPPILKIIDLESNETIATANGWAIGPPFDDGELLYLEEYEEEFRYRVRSTTRRDAAANITTPDGFWLPKVMLGNREGDRVLVFWAPRPGHSSPHPGKYRYSKDRYEQLWITTIERQSLIETNSLTLDCTTTWEHQSGIVLNPTAAELYFVEWPSGYDVRGWAVRAVNLEEMKERFTLELPAGEVSAKTERTSKEVMLAVSWDGSSLAALHGSYSHSLQPDTLHIVDVAKGDVTSTVHEEQGARWGANYSALAAIPNSSEIGVLNRSYVRDDGENFDGLSVIDLVRETLERRFDVLKQPGDEIEGLSRLAPHAFAITSTNVLVAPTSDDDDALRALSQTPSEWHRDDRPRVQAYDAYVAQMTKDSDGK